MSAWIWIWVVVVAVIAAIVVTTLIVRRNDARKVGFMMDALEDGELNFHFKLRRGQHGEDLRAGAPECRCDEERQAGFL